MQTFIVRVDCASSRVFRVSAKDKKEAITKAWDAWHSCGNDGREVSEIEEEDPKNPDEYAETIN